MTAPETDQSGNPAASGRWLDSAAAVCVLLAMAVLLVFGQSFGHSFVDYDDGQYFYDNPHVLAGLSWHNVAWGLRTGYTSNWHPLTWWSLMLDATLFGDGSSGPHLTNVVLHAASTVLLFLILRRLTGTHWRSAFVAALFGLHPLHVESVAWVSERKDVLSGFFFMLVLWAYARYAQANRNQKSKSKCFYALALFFFALGLMAKPMLVTLPFVLLLLDFWPLNRISNSTAKSATLTTNGNYDASSLAPHNAGVESSASTWPILILEKAPFFALSVASSLATLAAQREAIQPLAHISIGIRAVNAVVSCVRYLRKMFWPVNLALPYPHRGYSSVALFGGCLVLLVAASLVALRFRRKYPFLVTGWFWYLGMLVPVIGLVQVGMQSMADRYTYLPLIGIFMLLAWGAGALLEGLHWSGKMAVAAVALLLLAACAARSMDQLRYWQNSETLFLRTLAVTRENDIAEYNLAHYYFRHYRLDESIEHYLRAIEIRPGYDDALNNLGAALALQGKTNEALARIQEAIRLRPDKADAYYNLGNVLVMQHKLDDAIPAYEQAIKLKPDYAEAHNNLANVLFLQGRVKEAVAHYHEVLRLQPNHEGAKRQLRALETRPPG